jgi:1,4-alpha-glucan branching enzyme
MFHGLSSDWAFLITRGQSVDYALRRTEGHRRDFHVLAQLIEDGRRDAACAEAARQAAIDRAFPALDARLEPSAHERVRTTFPGMPATTERGG